MFGPRLRTNVHPTSGRRRPGSRRGCLSSVISNQNPFVAKQNKRLSYKHHHQFESVPPRKMLKAAKYLVKTSELFYNGHREVQENWLDNRDTRANDAIANQNNIRKEFTLKHW